MTILLLSICIIWPLYILSLYNILLAWSHLSFIGSLIFLQLTGHSLNCVPFQSNTCSMRQSARYHSPGYHHFLKILMFPLWGWSKSLMTLVAVYRSPQWGGGPLGFQSWQAVMALKTGTSSFRKERLKCKLAVSYFSANTMGSD